MPRYLSMVRIDEQNLPTEAPDPGFDERMGALLEEITKAGVMLDTAGLAPTSEGTGSPGPAASSATPTALSPRARKSSAATRSPR